MTPEELLSDTARKLKEANSVNVYLRARNRDLQMLAFGWCAAHDALAAGKPYDFPSPVDLPEALAELEKVRKALEGTHDTHGFVQECSKCNTQVLPDGSE